MEKQPSSSLSSEEDDLHSQAVLTDKVIEAMERAWMGDPTIVLGPLPSFQPSSSTHCPRTPFAARKASEGGGHAANPQASFSSTSEEQVRIACPRPSSCASSTQPSITPTPTEPTPIPFSPSLHYPIPTKPIPATITAHNRRSDQEGVAKQPLRGANGATALNGPGAAARPKPSDFASVFFSPLPFSYLNAAQSNSTEQLLAQSDSPDVTLRAGRLAVGTSLAHEDWPVDVDLASSFSNQHLSNSFANDSPSQLEGLGRRHSRRPHSQPSRGGAWPSRGSRGSLLGSVSGGNLSEAAGQEALSPGMQGTLLAQAEAATSPRTQKSLQQEVEGLMKACGLMLEADVTRSPSTAETLLAEAAAAEAGTAGPVSLGQITQHQTLEQEQQSQPSDELPLRDPYDQHVHQQNQQQQLLDQPTLPQPCSHHKAVHCRMCTPSAPLNLPLRALQGAQRDALPTTPIAGPLQEEVAASSSHDGDHTTHLRASVPPSCSDLCAEDDANATSTASTPTTVPPTPGPSTPIVQAASTPSVPLTPGPSAPILQAASSTASTASAKSTQPSLSQAPIHVNSSSSEDSRSNSQQTSIGSSTDSACSAPAGCGIPSLPFPLPDTHSRLSISSCASHAQAPRQPQPTSAPASVTTFSAGASLQDQYHAHAPPHSSSEPGAAALTTSEKGSRDRAPAAPKLSSFALLHPAAMGGMVPMQQPQQHQQSGPLLAGSDVAQVRGGTSAIALAVQRARKNPQLSTMRLVAGASMIPHIDKADKGGEDAYCICTAGLGAIGVADGVSGWAEEGIDPAEYSRTLMRHCELAIEAAGTEAQGREVIRDAHQKTVMAGSSTVCLALMKPEGRLEVVNLGDSGVRVIREGVVAFASAAQQHMFNMPFQLSHPSIIESPDDADSASSSVVDVQPGDVIVLATDGLYDNMFDEEIARLCGDYMNRRRKSMRLLGSGDKPPTASELAAAAVAQARQQQFTCAEAGFLAQEIARLAHCYAHDPCRRTPWSVASCEQGFSWAHYFADGGGKMDDCTVVVAFVQPDTPQ